MSRVLDKRQQGHLSNLGKAWSQVPLGAKWTQQMLGQATTFFVEGETADEWCKPTFSVVSNKVYYEKARKPE